MRLRNGEHGYGAVTKTLHRLAVALFALQLVVDRRLVPRMLPARR